jgi:hypothetical protein
LENFPGNEFGEPFMFEACLYFVDGMKINSIQLPIHLFVYVPHLMVLYWCDHGAFSSAAPRLWNQLPSRVKEIASISALNPISLAVTYHTDSSAIIM